MHKSGQTIVLRAGDYQAKIVTVGAGLAELTYGERHLVIPHRPEEMPVAHMGKVLIPWPNRIANGSYHHDGELYLLPINDRISNSAIHGLLAWRDWQVSQQSPSAVTLKAFQPPSYGYPFMLVCEVTWQLDERAGLHASIISTNIGDRSAPYGAGVHPYLTCDCKRVDSYELTLPDGKAFRIDSQGDALRLIPEEKECFVFSTPGLIGEKKIDHTIKVNPAPTPWEVKISCPDNEMTTYLRSTQPWLQIYSGEKVNRIGLAVEPMSCPPDAFNSGIDLVLLAPNETHEMHFTIGSE